MRVGNNGGGGEGVVVSGESPKNVLQPRPINQQGTPCLNINMHPVKGENRR